jgi:hypothetical protein
MSTPNYTPHIIQAVADHREALRCEISAAVPAPLDPPLDEHNTVSGHETGTGCMWFLPALVLGMGFWAAMLVWALT